MLHRSVAPKIATETVHYSIYSEAAGEEGGSVGPLEGDVVTDDFEVGLYYRNSVAIEIFFRHFDHHEAPAFGSLQYYSLCSYTRTLGTFCLLLFLRRERMSMAAKHERAKLEKLASTR